MHNKINISIFIKYCILLLALIVSGSDTSDVHASISLNRLQIAFHTMLQNIKMADLTCYTTTSRNQ